MSKKYIIEIEEIPFEQRQPDVFTEEGRIMNPLSRERLYRVVGFPSIFFTQEQLDRLLPFPGDPGTDNGEA